MWSVVGIILISVNLVIGIDYIWRDYTGTIPSDAFRDKDTDFAIAKIYSGKYGSYRPTGLKRSDGIGVKYEYETIVENIKVLCTMNTTSYSWEWVNGFHLMSNTKNQRGLVKGGTNGASNVYIAKIYISGRWYIGELNDNGCSFFIADCSHQITKNFWCLLPDCMVLRFTPATTPVTTTATPVTTTVTPVVSKPVLLGSNHYWREYNGVIPSDAFKDFSSNLYIAQITFATKACGGLAPAGFNPVTKEATTQCYGKSTTTKNLKILCTQYPERSYWEWVDVSKLTAGHNNWVIGGHEDSICDLYIGKIFKDGTWMIGKVFSCPYKQSCNFYNPINDHSLRTTECWVLKYL